MTEQPLQPREDVPDAHSPEEVEHTTPHDDEPDDGPNADDGDDGSG
jgi:hypothetical protein